MAIRDWFRGAETRSIENPNVPLSAENFYEAMGWDESTFSILPSVVNVGRWVTQFPDDSS